MSHTSGPWKLNGNCIEALTDECNSDGIPLTAVLAEIYTEIDNTLPRSENNANAALMKAAPDLLAACQGLIKYRDRNSLNWQLEKADYFIDAIRAAIAKAKGQ